MNDFFSQYAEASGCGTAILEPRFDAERDTPEICDALFTQVPVLHDAMASLRRAVPLPPHSEPGQVGNFVRLPNHYRSVNFMIPGTAVNDLDRSPGVIAFKGTEPLLPDFHRYLSWMLRAPFRSSAIPMALHFTLELKLPPAAMWIQECLIEQDISSKIQREYLSHYGRLARLPVPLFVYGLRREAVQQYEALIRRSLTSADFRRIEAKIADGLGIEVYYYPSLPVRAADLFVSDVRETCLAALRRDALEPLFIAWIELLHEMLHLGYMPFAPWNHGMGACVDPGNACIDGGFSDLLTLVPCESIPTEQLFRRSLFASMQLLANSIAAVCASASNIPLASQLDSTGPPFAYVLERLRARVRDEKCRGHTLDARLRRFFDVPTVSDVIDHLGELQQSRREGTQFSSSPVRTGTPDGRIVVV